MNIYDMGSEMRNDQGHRNYLGQWNIHVDTSNRGDSGEIGGWMYL